MKFMKLGTRPDIFYTEQATRTVVSEVPSDLVIRINNITYLIHKFLVIPKCGLLQRRLSSSSKSNSSSGDEETEKKVGNRIIEIELNDIPGGEEAFEVCAKFCYGITINLSAHNFVSAFCAAKFLGMKEESMEKGNLIAKLEAFFVSCILSGWKDSIITLSSTVGRLSECSHNLGITTKCIDSIVHKILTPLPKVSWSYTYTRAGYIKQKHRSVPKDWWTEDISDLDIHLFRCIIMAISSTHTLPPQLIGEALHVYSRRWLPETSTPKPNPPPHPDPEASVSHETTPFTTTLHKNQQILETIVTLIPPDRESVSVSFCLRLLSIANYVGASQVTKTEVIRRCGLLLEQATVSDLLFPSHLNSVDHFYDVDLVVSVLESFLMVWRRHLSPQAQPAAAAADDAVVEINGDDDIDTCLISVRKVGKVIDCYLQMAAKDRNMPVSKMIYLAEALPEVARTTHDDIYKAIDIFLKEHLDLSKADKKRLCRVLNCKKLSPELRAHAVKNERLPLRTVVQVLFFEQDKGSSKMSSRVGGAGGRGELIIPKRPATGDDHNPSGVRFRQDDEKFRRSESTRTRRAQTHVNAQVPKTMKKDEQKMKIKTELIKQHPHELLRKVSKKEDREDVELSVEGRKTIKSMDLNRMLQKRRTRTEQIKLK